MRRLRPDDFENLPFDVDMEEGFSWGSRELFKLEAARLANEVVDEEAMKVAGFCQALNTQLTIMLRIMKSKPDKYSPWIVGNLMVIHDRVLELRGEVKK